MCEAMWRELMAVDTLGAQWGANGEGVMRAPNRMNFGWRGNLAKIQAPTLVLLGEFDNYRQRMDAWKGLRVDHKLFIKVACASHFMQFERARHLLRRATCSAAPPFPGLRTAPSTVWHRESFTPTPPGRLARCKSDISVFSRGEGR